MSQDFLEPLMDPGGFLPYGSVKAPDVLSYSLCKVKTRFKVRKMPGHMSMGYCVIGEIMAEGMAT